MKGGKKKKKTQSFQSTLELEQANLITIVYHKRILVGYTINIEWTAIVDEAKSIHYFYIHLDFHTSTG